MISLSRLFIHPVKSMRGTQVSHAQARESGLAFDRVFMITELDGTFITARQYSEMVLFTPAVIPDGLFLAAPDGSSATVRFDDFQPEAAPTEVWGNQFTAQIAPVAINDWLSSFFPRPVQLRWVGHEMTRRVKHFEHIPLGFADGFPFLLINEASLYDLRQRCPAGIKLEQFRPNLVVAGAAAWAEDSWSTVQIGEILFDVPKPCSRCIFTTVSPEGGRRHPRGEPLSTLQTFRTAQDDSGDIDFGMNLIARNSGILRVGDELQILASKPPRPYGASKSVEPLEVDARAQEEIAISWQGETFKGNNQQVLLEQLEMADYRIPYSCRAGICGRCRVKLLSGEVRPLKKGAVREDGTILSCSCVPASHLQLSGG
ncbi:MOSC domain-containing protein [Erwinia endophytica]|uniref:YcbX family protein n=1 Tax=Erwinia endophytica TaxID=1563158 RepID=UPI001265E32F|nr:YcbX family protein [Erwinia endophytica]KAB8313242.1 MOSC domain-containing protein [Erwinia endophytica]